MRNEFIVKHIRFTQTQIDILDDFIKETPGINSYAEAVRYAVLCLKDDVNTEDLAKNVERKINTVSKNIDILIEMTAGGFDKQDVNIISKKAKDTFIYQDAIKNVEDEIQKSTTIKSNFKKANIEPKPQLEEKKFQPSKPLFR